MPEPHEDPIQLKTTRSLKTVVGAIMQRHGCIVEESRITLPVGSTRTLRRQYLQTTRWYDLVLPDAFRMLEAYDLRRGLSILFVPPECVQAERRKDDARRADQ